MLTYVDVSAEDQNQLTANLSRGEQKLITVKTQKQFISPPQRWFCCSTVFTCFNLKPKEAPGGKDEPSGCFKKEQLQVNSFPIIYPNSLPSTVKQKDV